MDWQSRRFFWEHSSKQKGVQLGRRMNLERKKMVGMCVFFVVLLKMLQDRHSIPLLAYQVPIHVLKGVVISIGGKIRGRRIA